MSYRYVTCLVRLTLKLFYIVWGLYTLKRLSPVAYWVSHDSNKNKLLSEFSAHVLTPKDDHIFIFIERMIISFLNFVTHAFLTIMAHFCLFWNIYKYNNPVFIVSCLVMFTYYDIYVYKCILLLLSVIQLFNNSILWLTFTNMKITYA